MIWHFFADNWLPILIGVIIAASFIFAVRIIVGAFNEVILQGQ